MARRSRRGSVTAEPNLVEPSSRLAASVTGRFAEYLAVTNTSQRGRRLVALERPEERSERAPSGEPTEGEPSISFDGAADVLGNIFPGLEMGAIESTLLAEWNAFTGGRPSHVPAQVLVGAIEVLNRRHADDGRPR